MQGREVNNYILASLISQTEMSEVWLAHHKRLRTPAAVKFLSQNLTRDPKFRERFFQEAQTQASLRHPHIAQVLDYDEQNGDFFLIIEYLSGGSLAEMIGTHGVLEIEAVRGWAKQILRALDYAHQRGIIHRDVKPSNIMFDDNGDAKVVDFGIALVMGDHRLTSTGISIGTPHYMSPEQVLRPKNLDHRTDVYSMGIVLYEMLTGKPPFEGETEFVIKSAQVNNPPIAPSQYNAAIPLPLEQIILQALEKNPDQRQGGCGQFARAIESFETALSETALPAQETNKSAGGGTASAAASVAGTTESETVIRANAAGVTASRRSSSVSNYLLVGGVATVIAVIVIGVLLWWRTVASSVNPATATPMATATAATEKNSTPPTPTPSVTATPTPAPLPTPPPQATAAATIKKTLKPKAKPPTRPRIPEPDR